MPMRDIPFRSVMPYIALIVLVPISMINLWSAIWWLWQWHLLPSGTHGLTPWKLNDFGMFWAAAHFSASPVPAEVYDIHRLLNWENLYIPSGDNIAPWLYPPPTLLLMRLISHLSYWRAYAVWTIGLSIISIVALRLARLPFWVIIVAMLSPAALYNLMLGQISVYSGAFFVASLMLINILPANSGALSALTIFKPQAALLAPIAILAQRKRRGLIAGLLTVSILCILTFFWFGPSVWTAYFNRGLHSSSALIGLPYPRQEFGPNYLGNFEYAEISVFFMLRSFGIDQSAAMAGQVVVSIGAIVVNFILWNRKDLDPIARVVVTIFLSLLVTPYGFPQDMFAYSLGIIIMIWQRKSLEFSDIILLFWPSFLIFGSRLTHTNLTPVFVVWAIYRTRMIQTALARTKHAWANQ
jgi:hypothetical protein